MKYIDKNGRRIEAGQYLKYDEGQGGACSVDIVEDRDGVLWGRSLFFEYGGVLIEAPEPEGVEIKYYVGHDPDPNQFRENVLTDAEVMDVDHPSQITLEFVRALDFEALK